MERLPARARTAINGSHTADGRQPWERLGVCLAAAGLAIGLGACEPQSQVSTGTAATPVRATAAPASDAPTVTSAGRIADGTRPSIPPTTHPAASGTGAVRVPDRLELGSTQPPAAALPQASQSARTSDVALLLPLTGQASSVGRALSNAAQLAVFDLGVDAFTYRIYDTRGTIEGAQMAVEMAVLDGVGLIVGPLFGQSAAAVGPIAAAAGLNVVSFSNNRSVAGGPVFVFGLLPSAQVDRVVGFAADRGYGRFAIMAPSTPFGEGVAIATGSAVSRTGAAIVDSRRYPPGDGDLTPMVKDLADFDRRAQDLKEQRALLAERTDEASKRALNRLKGRDTIGDPAFDALMLPSTAKKARQLTPLLAYYDIDPARVRFLGTATWDEPGLGREPTMVGSWYAAPAPEARLAFEARYQKAFGERPPRLASLAYDATALAVSLSLSEGGPAYDRASLLDPVGFAGVDGIFRFVEDGTNQRGLAVWEVRPDGARVIDGAPTTFADLVN